MDFSIASNGGPAPRREALCWHYPHYHNGMPGGSIRKGDWKLIEWFETGDAVFAGLGSLGHAGTSGGVACAAHIGGFSDSRGKILVNLNGFAGYQLRAAAPLPPCMYPLQKRNSSPC